MVASNGKIEEKIFNKNWTISINIPIVNSWHSSYEYRPKLQTPSYAK